ncbi:MAG: M20/M25/M40 family metallo-hydrolase [Cyanobacteriota bacterium]|nr:M20/M25/M40 family metallo-hydrolase [Cyanobacteriota bacterium]
MNELSERLLVHLREVARDRDPYFAPLGHLSVREYIRQKFKQWGEVEIDEFEVNGKTHQNLILNLPPLENEVNSQKRQFFLFDSLSPRSIKKFFSSSSANKELAPILIGAHYDAVPGSPGADDNATGIAVLLEMAREFAAKPLKYPVKLVAFDLEEMGFLGSEHYAEKLQQEQQELRLMISLEMLGYCDKSPNSQSYPTGLKYFYPDKGDFIALINNFPALYDTIAIGNSIRKKGTPCEWLPVPNRGLPVPDTRRSDHVPFWDRGYRAIMVTDTANMRNPNYHQESDTTDTLDLDFLTGVCQGLIAGLRTL